MRWSLIACVVGLASRAHAATCTVSSSKTVAACMTEVCSGGGGTVVVPSGTFAVNEPLEFPCGNLELQLAKGSQINAPSTKAAYGGKLFFIHASKRDNIKITGSGVIDGKGSIWWPDSSTDSHPDLILFEHCTRVTVQGIHLTNSPKLTLVPTHCDNTRITDVTITNPYTSSSKNLDCIDPSGTNIYIANCDLNCGDDNVAIKGPSENVLVENCRFGTGHGASIGSITSDLVRNVTFRNIKMTGTDNGCRIKTKVGYTGGKVMDILFDTITMDGVGYPIVIDGMYTSSPHNAEGLSDVADISGVTFRHITSTNAKKTSYIKCDSAHPCKDVTLWDIHDSMPITCSNAHGTAKTPLSPASLSTCLT